MVTAPARSRRYMIDDLQQLPDDGRLRELVDGEIVEWDMPTHLHAFLVIALGAELRRFAREHRHGRVVGGEAMVRILGSAHDARAADIAFYARGRLPHDVNAAATMTTPDLVVEIISPSDRADRVHDKVRDWLRAGVQLLWYVNLETGTTAVYHGDHVRFVDADEPLDGGDVLPGFQLRIRELLDEFADDAE